VRGSIWSSMFINSVFLAETHQWVDLLPRPSTRKASKPSKTRVNPPPPREKRGIRTERPSTQPHEFVLAPSWISKQLLNPGDKNNSSTGDYFGGRCHFVSSLFHLDLTQKINFSIKLSRALSQELFESSTIPRGSVLSRRIQSQRLVFIIVTNLVKCVFIVIYSKVIIHTYLT